MWRSLVRDISLFRAKEEPEPQGLAKGFLPSKAESPSYNMISTSSSSSSSSSSRIEPLNEVSQGLLSSAIVSFSGNSNGNVKIAKAKSIFVPRAKSSLSRALALSQKDRFKYAPYKKR